MSSLARSGANGDITSLTGLATPLSPAQGGTGRTDGGASPVDVAIASQNILYQGLLIAALRNVPTGLVDGVIDPFSSLADINTAASSGYIFTASAGTIGSAIGNGALPNGTALSSGYIQSPSLPPSNAFDGNLSTYWQSSTYRVNNPWIGQQFNAAYNVTSFTISHQSPNGASSKVSLQYSDDGSSYNTAGTYVLVMQIAAQTISTPVSSSGVHKYWRLLNVDNDNTSSTWNVSELSFTGNSGAPMVMTLQSATLASAVASPSSMRALIQVDSTSASSTPNTDVIVALSRDGGTTFTQGTLALVQSMPDGTVIYDTGWRDVSGQPTGNSTMTYKITTPTAKAIVLTGVSMQVRP